MAELIFHDIWELSSHLFIIFQLPNIPEDESLKGRIPLENIAAADERCKCVDLSLSHVDKRAQGFSQSE